MIKRILLSLLFSLLSLNAGAYQQYTAKGTVDTVGQVNLKDGKPALQQDMINNANSPQTNRTFGYVFGRNSLVQNVRCDLWDGPTCTYVFPTVAQQMAVSSSAAGDALAGTGCQKVIIHYLDGAYAVQTETVSLNGVTPVNTVATNIFRINSFHCSQLGSGGTTAGNISVKNIGATVTYAYIAAGYETARQAVYTVPAGVSGYISHWQASSGSATGTHYTQVSVRATSHDGVLLPGVFLLVDEVGTLNNSSSITLPTPIRIPATTDVKMSAISDAANANAVVNGAIMGWFEQ